MRLCADRVDFLMIEFDLGEDRPTAKSTAKSGKRRSLQGTGGRKFFINFEANKNRIRQARRVLQDLGLNVQRAENGRHARNRFCSCGG